MGGLDAEGMAERAAQGVDFEAMIDGAGRIGTAGGRMGTGAPADGFAEKGLRRDRGKGGDEARGVRGEVVGETMMWTRGPQLWSRDISSSKPRSSEP